VTGVPIGIESYDEAIASRPIEYRRVDAQKEREVWAAELAGNERVINRYFAEDVFDPLTGATIQKMERLSTGAPLLVTNRAVLVMDSKGTFRQKTKVTRIGLEHFEDYVGTVDPNPLDALPKYFGVLRFKNGDELGFRFREQDERDSFGRCFKAAVSMTEVVPPSSGDPRSMSSGRSIDPDAAHVQATVAAGWEATQNSDVPMSEIRPTTEEILAEWLPSDAATDRKQWQEGIERYDRSDLEDYAEMCASSELMCSALTHYLRGQIITPGDTDQSPESQVAQTTWNVLVATLQGNDETSFGPQSERQLRLALAAVRLGNHQSEDLGGRGTFAPIFDDQGRRLIMTAALAGADSVNVSAMEFHLGQWFRVPTS
jgi:hypothetical protein